MVDFTCERYPKLRVNTPAGTVRFVDGRATAADEAAEVVRSIAEEFGITEVAEPQNDPPAAPAPAAPAKPARGRRNSR